MNATVTILESFDLQTRGEFVCRVEAGQTFDAKATGTEVSFWVQDGHKMLHPVRLEANSPAIKIELWKK